MHDKLIINNGLYLHFQALNLSGVAPLYDFLWSLGAESDGASALSHGRSDL
jgi:hypothetical protein